MQPHRTVSSDHTLIISYFPITMRFILIVLITVFCIDAHGQILDSTYLSKSDSIHAVLAQTPGSHIFWHDIKDGWYDLGKYVTSPFHFSASQWGLFGAGVVVTAGFEVFADVPVHNNTSEVFPRNKSKFSDQFSQFGDNFYG